MQIQLFFRPKENKSKLEKFSHFLAIFTSLATIVGFFFGIRSLNLTNEQLKKINAQGEILIDLGISTDVDVIVESDGGTSPFEVYLTARNHGDFTPSYWRVSAFFCNNVEILQADEDWIYDGYNQYFFESKRPLIPGLMIYGPVFDEIGNFNVRITIPEGFNLKSPIPIALVYGTGENSRSVPRLVSIQSGNVIREEVTVNHGRMDVRGCRTIE